MEKEEQTQPQELDVTQSFNARRQRGIINIKESLIDDEPELVRQFLAQFLVIRAERTQNGRVRYLLAAPVFPSVANLASVPEYKIGLLVERIMPVEMLYDPEEKIVGIKVVLE